jgi:hypothetical protein
MTPANTSAAIAKKRICRMSPPQTVRGIQAYEWQPVR